MGDKAKICPRCGNDGIVALCDSQVAEVWVVHRCGKCLYVWRSSEPPRRSDRAHYPEAFRLTDADISHSEEIPVVPPLKVQN